MERTSIMNGDSLRSYNRWHLIVAAILAALLLLLPMVSSIGPNSWRACLPDGAAAAPASVTTMADTMSRTATVPTPTPAVVSVPAEDSAPPNAITATPPADAPPAAKVYFATAKWDIPASSDSTVGAVVGYLKSHTAAKALVSGFHDPRGSEAANAALSFNRAKAVRDFLATLGIPADRVLLNKPQSTTGTGSNAEARRVEVSVQP